MPKRVSREDILLVIKRNEPDGPLNAIYFISLCWGDGSACKPLSDAGWAKVTGPASVYMKECQLDEALRVLAKICAVARLSQSLHRRVRRLCAFAKWLTNSRAFPFQVKNNDAKAILSLGFDYSKELHEAMRDDLSARMAKLNDPSQEMGAAAAAADPAPAPAAAGGGDNPSPKDMTVGEIEAQMFGM